MAATTKDFGLKEVCLLRRRSHIYVYIYVFGGTPILTDAICIDKVRGERDLRRKHKALCRVAGGGVLPGV